MLAHVLAILLPLVAETECRVGATEPNADYSVTECDGLAAHFLPTADGKSRYQHMVETRANMGAWDIGGPIDLTLPDTDAADSDRNPCERF